MRTRIRRAIACLVCRYRGHEPRTIRSFEEALSRTMTSCRRCGTPLEFEERRGRFPLPTDRVKVVR